MPFDCREATVASIHEVLRSHRYSCRDIVQAFLARIELHNPSINALVALNPDALYDADKLDKQLAEGHGQGALFGVPVLLKDNFDVVGMPTTAGSLSFKDAWPTEDAPVVAALRKAGAIILGKTNMHEFALEGLTVSSLGGQTLNPYDLTRTAGGSSGGSGAAVAASFAVMATGSDTVNSLRSPASANSLYSLRPTPGMIPCAGVVPVSSTQDTVGMIGRSIQDIAIALTVMTNSNLVETTGGRTMQQRSSSDHRFLNSSASDQPVKMYRIGVLQDLIDRTISEETSPVSSAIDQVTKSLEGEQVTFIDIVNPSVFSAPNILATMDVQMYEIQALVNDYISQLSPKGVHPSSFSESFQHTSDPSFLVIPSQYSYIHTAVDSSTSCSEYIIRKGRIRHLVEALQQTFQEHSLDAVVYPQQRNLVVPIGSPSQSGRNGILAAVTGSPAVCMPIGFSKPTSTAPIGIPIGMEVLGMPWMETKLLEIATLIDEKLGARRPPITNGLAEKMEVKNRYDSVPVIVPGGLSSVDLKAYPPNTL